VILVTGATGNVGGAVVRALVAAGEPVRALTRGSAAGLPDGVEAVAGDLERPETLAGPLAGARALFLLPGYAGTAGVLAEARRAGVERVVLLSGSSAASGDETNAVTAYMMGSEAAVRDSGLPWTILRPFGFASNALQWVDQLRAGDVVRAAFPDARVAVVDPADIGAVAAAALRSGEHEGATYVVTGPEGLLPADRVRVLGEVLGRDLRFEGLSNEEARAELSASMPAEYVEAFFDFYVGGSLDESQPAPTVQDVTGRPPGTFEQWARAHADAFR
jgi:uncharacterized protein YbjT (DUF2867 family)